MPLQLPLRRSPRLTQKYDVYLFDVTKNKKGEPVLSKTSTILHEVNYDCSLSDLKLLIRAHEDHGTVYVPATGLFWLRKGTRQMVKLNVQADLDNCKREYNKPKLQSIRLACAAVTTAGNGGGNKGKRQIKLQHMNFKVFILHPGRTMI